MNDRCIQAIACAVALLIPAAAGAAEVKVPKKIEYSNKSRVRPQIVEQCGLQTLIPEAIASHSPDVELVDRRADLQLEITDAHGPGGWVFSGPKWVEVKGTLRRGGKVFPFRVKRYSAFDLFSGGTCGILAKCGRSIGADIAAWLEDPRPDAELGNAQ